MPTSADASATEYIPDGIIVAGKIWPTPGPSGPNTAKE